MTPEWAEELDSEGVIFSKIPPQEEFDSEPMPAHTGVY
jgi:hypothetical protein